jgi:hypothetical protein
LTVGSYNIEKQKQNITTKLTTIIIYSLRIADDNYANIFGNYIPTTPTAAAQIIETDRFHTMMFRQMDDSPQAKH